MPTIAHEARGRVREALVFGPFAFMPEEHELRRDGVVVHLQRQPAMVLAYLLEHRDRAVSREELIRHVWRDGRHVGFDQGLNFCVRQIRRALHDRAAAPQYVETVAREGYRWIAGVSRASPIWAGGPLIHSSGGCQSRSRDLTIAGTAVSTTLVITLLLRLFSPLEPVSRLPAPDRRSTSHLSLALDALHVLSHAIFEPAREPEAERAIRTLLMVTASHFGFPSDTDLTR